MYKIILKIFLLVLFLVGCVGSPLVSAKLHIQKEEYYEAKKILEDLVKENQRKGGKGYYDNAEAYYLLGYLEGELNNFDSMIDYFNKSEEISWMYSNDIEDTKQYYWATYFNKGVINYKDEDYNQAKYNFEIAMKIKPNDYDTKQNYDFVISMLSESDANSVQNTSSMDGNMSSNNSKKDIDGFQNYKWDLTLDEVKKLIENMQYEIDESNNNFQTISVSKFIFQDKESILDLHFYKNRLYKLTVHFPVSDNTAGMNEYFSLADLMQDVYGSTNKIAIGRESDDYNHRVTQLSIGALSYQHRWHSPSGNLVFQLSDGSYGNFICSLFYSSENAKQIDEEKAKSEF